MAEMRSNLATQETLCRGFLVEWMAGSMWNTYLYQHHAEGAYHLPWEPIAVENDHWLSKDCIVRVLGAGKACLICAAVPSSEQFLACVN